MPERHLVVIQKQGSPMRPVVDALGAGDVIRRCQGPPLPEQAFGPDALTLWDLHGFDPNEMDSLADELAAGSAGVLVLCEEPDQTCRRLLGRINALGLVCHRQGPEALAAALELARAAHARLHALLAERESLRQMLSDRLVVEKAKRLLMESHGFCEEDAHRRLQKHARDTNQKLVQVARQLLAGHQAMDGDGPDEEP